MLSVRLNRRQTSSADGVGDPQRERGDGLAERVEERRRIVVEEPPASEERVERRHKLRSQSAAMGAEPRLHLLLQPREVDHLRIMTAGGRRPRR